jgi:hypothetical protein
MTPAIANNTGTEEPNIQKSAQTEPATAALIVFGKDGAGKPHASWFDDKDAALAEKAAGLTN